MREAVEKNPEMTQAQAVKVLMDALKVLYYRDARSLNKVGETNWSVSQRFSSTYLSTDKYSNFVTNFNWTQQDVTGLIL